MTRRRVRVECKAIMYYVKEVEVDEVDEELIDRIKHEARQEAKFWARHGTPRTICRVIVS